MPVLLMERLRPEWGILLLLVLGIGSSSASFLEDDQVLLANAMDMTVKLASGARQASQNKRCFESLKALMIRNNIPSTVEGMRMNLTDAELLRIGILASIALISPWDQDPMSGRLLISDHGVLLEAYHPSTSESDIMLCVVCSLLAVIIMFHVTNAQQQFVMSAG